MEKCWKYCVLDKCLLYIREIVIETLYNIMIGIIHIWHLLNLSFYFYLLTFLIISQLIINQNSIVVMWIKDKNYHQWNNKKKISINIFSLLYVSLCIYIFIFSFYYKNNEYNTFTIVYNIFLTIFNQSKLFCPSKFHIFQLCVHYYKNRNVSFNADNYC